MTSKNPSTTSNAPFEPVARRRVCLISARRLQNLHIFATGGADIVITHHAPRTTHHPRDDDATTPQSGRLTTRGRLDLKKRVKSSADVAPSRQFVARIARSTQGMDTLTRYDDVNVEHDAFAHADLKRAAIAVEVRIEQRRGITTR